jgi:hypothetical protein
MNLDKAAYEDGETIRARLAPRLPVRRRSRW